MNNLREKVKEIAEKGLVIIDEYFDGKRQGIDKVKEAFTILNQAIKVEHMDQIKEQSNRSFGLRLLNFLPEDEDLRNVYIMKTNPELRPLLLDRPKK